ncbi:MAG: hypothetical protein OXI30_02360 [Chloroflexota bacterium]|nr:hypothetical protein [Chloroflexota bacterium]
MVGAICLHFLAGNLPEGAIAGALLGGSIGLLIAVRRHYGASGPAFEYEAAGIHDGNLITTARRNLVREAYRESFAGKSMHDETEEIAKAHPPRRE